MSLGLGVAGIQNTADGGLGNVIRLGQQADQIVSELHGRYYEQTVRGKVFSVNTQGTAVTTTAALATTWTGLGIANAPVQGSTWCYSHFPPLSLRLARQRPLGFLAELACWRRA